MDEMKRLFEDAGLRYRQDLTLQKLFQKMGSRRFDSYAISEEADVDMVMKNAFVFAEISDLEKKGYGMSPFGKEKPQFQGQGRGGKTDPVSEWSRAARLV